MSPQSSWCIQVKFKTSHGLTDAQLLAISALTKAKSAEYPEGTYPPDGTQVFQDGKVVTTRCQMCKRWTKGKSMHSGARMARGLLLLLLPLLVPLLQPLVLWLLWFQHSLPQLINFRPNLPALQLSWWLSQQDSCAVQCKPHRSLPLPLLRFPII